ncbi:MAG: diaminopimelate epimerase [Candidatus Muiribacteriota bacterium]
MNFIKMHGAGNDYIYFTQYKSLPENAEFIAKELSQRRFSVGSDGIVFLLPSDKADGKMIMFNSDGSRGMMCGNALRCVGKLIADKNPEKKCFTVETDSGMRNVRIDNKDSDEITIEIGKSVFETEKIPAIYNKKEILSEKIQFEDRVFTCTAVNVGNPHCVIPVDKIDDEMVLKYGMIIENSSIFPEKANVEFMEIVDRKKFKMRVWERGSGETFSCGTGAAACFAAGVKLGFFDNKVTSVLKGGDFENSIDKDGIIWQKGKVKKVFEASLEY